MELLNLRAKSVMHVRLKILIEKPEISKAKSNLAIAARYIFNPVIFDFIDKTMPDDGESFKLLTRFVL